MNDVKEFVTEEKRYFSKSHEGKELPMDMVFYPRLQGMGVRNVCGECAIMKLHHLFKEYYCECICHKRRKIN